MFKAKIDRQERTISIPRSAFIAAGQFGTPEFHQMMEMRQKFPGYEFVEQKIARNSDKRTYGNLTYKVMRGFIESHETDAEQRANLLKEYEMVQAISRTQRAAYAYVKKWFLDKYGKEFKTFQEEQDARKRAKDESHLCYTPDTI